MRHHHGSDTPTSARAVLHHTDQKGPNIMHPSVSHSTLLKSCDWCKEGLDGRNTIVLSCACDTEETSVLIWSMLNTIYIH